MSICDPVLGIKLVSRGTCAWAFTKGRIRARTECLVLSVEMVVWAEYLGAFFCTSSLSLQSGFLWQEVAITFVLL